MNDNVTGFGMDSVRILPKQEGAMMMCRAIIWSMVLTVLMTGNAHAYIDPGTGSVVTTAIIGFFAAAAYTLRKYFYKLKDLFISKPDDTHSTKGGNE